MLLTSFTYVHCSFAHLHYFKSSTLHPLLAHHHLCYVDACYVFDPTFVSVIMFLLLYYVFWACHPHWLNWSHEYSVQYICYIRPNFFCLFFLIWYLQLSLLLHVCRQILISPLRFLCISLDMFFRRSISVLINIVFWICYMPLFCNVM